MSDPSKAEVNVPDFHVGGRWREIEAVGYENLALATRRHWGLGDNPISNVHLLLENNGVVTTALDFNCHELGGFCYRDDDGRPYVALSCDRASGAWSRLDAAHELGHLIMHGGVLASEINDETHALLERQAARFARSFLMPRDTFGKEVVRPRMVVFQRLKKRWNAPIVEMVRRMVDLDMVNVVEARRLGHDYGKLGWVGNEPEETEREQPLVIRRAIETVDREGVLSRTQLAGTMLLHPTDVGQGCGLPAGFFDCAPGHECRDGSAPSVMVGDFRAYC